MRWPLRNQVFVPFAGLLTASIFGVAFVSAWHAAEQNERQKLQHLRSIAASLGDANFPLTASVVQRIAGMVGGEVIYVDDRDVLQTATVAPSSQLLQQLSQRAQKDAPGNLTWRNEAWLVTVIQRRPVVGGGRLWVLIPQTQLSAMRWETLFLPLTAAAVTLALALLIAMWMSRRLGQRMQRLPALFDDLAAGRFPSISSAGKDDEVRDLLLSANRLSKRLDRLQNDLLRSERLQLLGQLSGGLAHQLRNAITGAKMGIQLHQKHCEGDPQDMLRTALAQLQLTEEQVRAVLSLKPEAVQPSAVQQVDLITLVREVELLLQPQCRHWSTTLQLDFASDLRPVGLRTPSAIKGALLNLILNAIEAAGVGGRVQIRIRQSNSDEVEPVTEIEILDNGGGFPAHLQSESMEAFQTTKADGIGLGLTIAQHAIANEDGSLQIGRLQTECDEDWTTVRLILPNSYRSAGDTTA